MPVQVSRRVVFGSPLEVGVGQGEGVAHGGVYGEPEEVADAADVAAGGVDLGQDAVFSQGLGSQGGSVPRELFADRGEAPCADPADEEVRVDAGRPGPVAVIQPGGEAYSYRAGQADVPAVEGQASVDDVGELQPGELAGGEGVEGD